jgi:amino acid transporter
MALLSWWNDPSQVDRILVVVGLVWALIGLGVFVAALIKARKTLEGGRKKRLDQHIKIFSCVAAFLFVAWVILAARSSVLNGKDTGAPELFLIRISQNRLGVSAGLRLS